MLTRSIELFKLFGISIRVDLSWVFIAVLITWSLAAGFYPNEFPGLSVRTYWVMGVVGALGLFTSIILHELGHALMAQRFQLPIRGITLFIFGGVAEMTEEPRSPRAEFWVAIAGPLVSVAIVLVCFGLELLGRGLAWGVPVRGVLWYLGFINLLVVGFNLVPAFPLDGGRVLRSILWKVKGSLRWATQVTSTIGSTFGMVLIFLGVVSVLSGNFIGGMWWFLLGMFLRGAAQMSYQQLILRRALEGEPISRLMQTEVRTVPPTATVREFVDDYIYRYHFKMFPVTSNGKVLGCVTSKQVSQVPRDQWDHRTVGELLTPCTVQNTVRPDEDAMSAFLKMRQNELSQLMVVENEQLRGIVSGRDMLRYLSLKMELEEGTPLQI